MALQTEKLPLFPITSRVNGNGCLEIGGCDITRLAGEYGTPLYIYDEITLREKAREFLKEFTVRYPTTINYSCKAFLNKAVLQVFHEEGLSLDVVSGGEIGIATAFGFPADRIDFPGNNKSAEELVYALETGVRHIVVDNYHELDMLERITGELGKCQEILLRLSPGVDPETHQYIITGNLDSKFGIPMAQAEGAVVRAMNIPGIDLKGLHFHLGSQLKSSDSFIQAVGVFLEFAAVMKNKHGFILEQLSVGGGFAHCYVMQEEVPPIAHYAEVITGTIREKCSQLSLDPPKLIVEPGRAMVASAGVAVYTVGAIKDIPGIRKYVSVDGGMGDNIQPALYGDRFEAVVADRMNRQNEKIVTICGKYCESGDILIKDIELPEIIPGAIIAMPGCGAYNITESMNYNASYRPAVVMVKDGKSTLIRRRETIQDLMRCDLV